MSIGIYKITNIINNKCYIGQSCNIEWHSTKGKALTSEQASLNAGKIKKEDVYLIRELYDSGIPPIKISILLKDLPIQLKEIRKIGKREKFSKV